MNPQQSWIPEFRRRLKKLRLKKDYTQTYLSRLCGLHGHTVAQLEQGHRKPTIVALRVLTIVLGASADYLLGLKTESGVKEGPDVEDLVKKYVETAKLEIQAERSEAVESVSKPDKVSEQSVVEQPRKWRPG